MFCTNETDFDSCETNNFIYNRSDHSLYVLESELTTDQFMYKDLESNVMNLFILQTNEKTMIKKERFFSVLSIEDDINYEMIKTEENESEMTEMTEMTEMKYTIENNEEYESFLYDTQNSSIKNMFKHLNTGNYKITIEKFNKYDMGVLRMKYNDKMIDSIIEINKEKKINENNMFYNNKLIKSIYAIDVCYWIINEALKHTFGDSIYKGFGNTLNITNIPHVMNYVLYSSNLWIIYFKKLYGIDETSLNLNIRDIFIASNSEKYNIIKNDTNKKNGFICKVLLNDTVDFKGGNMSINKNTIELKQGEMLIYNMSHDIVYEDITFGMAYYMCFILEIDF